MSEYIFNKTKHERDLYPPKKLHLMRTNIVSNIMLTHIVVELGLDKILIYDPQVFKQWD